MDMFIFFIGLGLFLLGVFFFIFSYNDPMEGFLALLIGAVMMMVSNTGDGSNKAKAEPTKYEIITIKKLVTPSDTIIKSIDTTYQKIN